MSERTMELEKQLAVEKAQLRTSLESIGKRASDTVDWRHHVRARPVETLGIAVVLGVVVGALTSRPSARLRTARGATAEGNVPLRETPDASLPEWNRLKAGLVGIVADRAIIAAQDFLEHATRPRSVQL